MNLPYDQTAGLQVPPICLEGGLLATIRDADGILLTLKLSQQELGSLIGLSRESVNLCLSDFKRQGLVESSGRSLRLLEPEKLAALR